MLTIQMYTYYRRFPQDKAAYKILVSVEWSQIMLILLIKQIFVRLH